MDPENITPSELDDQEPVLDMNTVTGLKRIPGEGRDVFAELVELFLENTAERMDGLLLAIERNDLERVVQESHALKSSSANLGVIRLSDICKDFERLGLNRDMGSVKARASELKNTYSEACKALVGALD